MSRSIRELVDKRLLWDTLQARGGEQTQEVVLLTDAERCALIAKRLGETGVSHLEQSDLELWQMLLHCPCEEQAA